MLIYKYPWTKNTKQENVQLQRECEKWKHNLEGKINDLEKYSRRNKIRMSGVWEKEYETIEENCNSRCPDPQRGDAGLYLYEEDIDIAHQLDTYTIV